MQDDKSALKDFSSPISTVTIAPCSLGAPRARRGRGSRHSRLRGGALPGRQQGALSARRRLCRPVTQRGKNVLEGPCLRSPPAGSVPSVRGGRVGGHWRAAAPLGHPLARHDPVVVVSRQCGGRLARSLLGTKLGSLRCQPGSPLRLQRRKRNVAPLHAVPLATKLPAPPAAMPLPSAGAAASALPGPYGTRPGSRLPPFSLSALCGAGLSSVFPALLFPPPPAAARSHMSPSPPARPHARRGRTRPLPARPFPPGRRAESDGCPGPRVPREGDRARQVPASGTPGLRGGGLSPRWPLAMGGGRTPRAARRHLYFRFPPPPSGGVLADWLIFLEGPGNTDSKGLRFLFVFSCSAL